MITPHERRQPGEDNLPPCLYGLILVGGSDADGGTAACAAKLFEVLDEHCDLVFLASREAQALTSPYVQYPQIFDAFESIPGPMNALLSAFNACPGVAWLAAAATRPVIDAEAVAHLIVNRNPEKAATAYVEPSDGLPEPLCTIYEPRYGKLLAGYARNGITCPRKALVRMENEVELLPRFRGTAMARAETD